MTKPTDYRAALEKATVPSTAGWVGPRRIRELLDGYAAQAVQEHQERWATEASGEERAHSEVLADALHMHGFTPDAAQRYIREFQIAVRARALKDSDHESYRVLADAVAKTMDGITDPNDWDGEDSEEYVLCQFLTWLPDMARHADAEKLRTRAEQSLLTENREYARGMASAANAIDPFERDSEGRWIRKSDGTQVPWSVVKK